MVLKNITYIFHPFYWKKYTFALLENIICVVFIINFITLSDIL